MRAKKTPIRKIEADVVYNSVQVSKLINRIMERGKKSVAQRLVYDAFNFIEAETKESPITIFEQAVSNIAPKIEVRSRRVGGAAYQVPMPVKPNRAFSLALRWLVNEANKRPNAEFKTFSEKLAAEILDAANNQGGAVQKKLTSHKMAEANKAFAHFRW